jgi:hypothetical protein
MLVRNLFHTFTSIQYFCLETFFLIKTGIIYFCISALRLFPARLGYNSRTGNEVMSVLRIFLEGDHGKLKQTYEDPTKPTYLYSYTCVCLALAWPALP